MRRVSDRQTGFSIIEVVLVVAVIGVVGAAGWFVYQHNRPKVTDAASGNQATNQNGNQQSTGTTPAPTVSYLDIKEWGVKLPLSDSIKDAYYVVSNGSVDSNGQPNTMLLGLTSLESSCGNASLTNQGSRTALGDIGRALPTDHDPVLQKPYVQLYPGVTIGQYYYFYISGTKDKTCASAATLQSIDSAFTTAAKGIVSATPTAN